MRRLGRNGSSFALRVASALGALAWAGCGTGTRGPILWGPSPTEAPKEVVFLSGSTMTTEQAGDVDGSVSSDVCPTNQVVIGYRGSLSSDVFVNAPGPATPVIGVIQTLCGALSLGDASSSELSIASGAVLAARGMDPGAAWSANCPPDEVVEGFSGRRGFYLDQVQITCAGWTLSPLDAAPGLAIAGTTTLAATGGGGGMPFPFEQCPRGEMATGTTIQAGQYVEGFGLICAAPSLQKE